MNPAARFPVSRFLLFFFFSFFSCMWIVISHEFTVQGTKITIHTLFITVHALKNIKNWSHGTIHTFKNYFVTVLSVFNFNNNKLNPNGPIVYQLYQLGNSKKKNKITKVAMGVLRVLFFFFFFSFSFSFFFFWHTFCPHKRLLFIHC